MNIGRRMAGLALAALAAGLLAAQSAPTTVAPASDLNQLMRGLFFPQANVYFSVQRTDPGTIAMGPSPSGATDPLVGVFGKWEAVENSALMMTDAADLLMTPGRKCTNGRDVPMTNPDWVKYVNQLREAGKVAYQAALAKDRQKVIDATDVLNASCADCHNKFRPRAIENRCK